MARGEYLTDQQQKFVEQYLIDLNGKQAAIRAGYKATTADRQASRMLSLGKVQAAVQAGKARQLEKADISADFVLRRAVEYLNTSIGDFLVIPEDGGIPYFDLRNATKQQLACLDALEIEATGKVKLTLTKRKEMLELIGKHIAVGAFRENLQLTGKDDAPLVWNINVVAAPGKPAE